MKRGEVWWGGGESEEGRSVVGGVKRGEVWWGE